MARQGKIARLPHSLRQEVNTRLLNGETAKEILTWLNANKEADAVWWQHFEGAPATAQNLSEWRLGGYKDWLKQRERADQLKTLSSYALNIASSGKNISEGAAAIAAGRLVEMFEDIADAGNADDPEAQEKSLAKLISALTSLRHADIARERLQLDRRKVTNKEREIDLAVEKFETQTVEQFIKWAGTDEAKKILDSGKTKSVQISLLRDLMFGKEKSK